MEKLCIVKRRRKGSLEMGDEDSCSLLDNPGVREENDYSFEEKEDKDKEIALSFGLTPDQREMVQSSEHVKSLLNGASQWIW